MRGREADALPLIDSAILKDLPTAPDNMKAALPLNPQFWGDNGERYQELRELDSDQP